MLRAVAALLLAAGLITAVASPAQAVDTDLLSGRPYTSSVAASASYPDTGGAELTDGRRRPRSWPTPPGRGATAPPPTSSPPTWAAPPRSPR